MNEDSKKIRILAVDDHSILRQEIAGLIAAESEMTMVARAVTGRVAIQQFRAWDALALSVDGQFQTRLGGVDAFRITL
jgi:DNA-binding NarL/FixJ family response regulator